MLLWIAERLLWINLGWYVVFALLFMAAGIYPKALYFIGAAILTVGIMLM